MAHDAWLLVDANHGMTSQHQRLVNTSKARAHAARMAHMRRREHNKGAPVVKIHAVTQQNSATYKTECLNGKEDTEVQLSPRAIVDNARAEPFQVFSVTLLEPENELLDAYINMFQRRFYGSAPSPNAFNWFRDIVFPAAIRNPVVFRCGVLGVAAVMKARFRDHVETLAQDMQSLELLQRHFRHDPDDCSDQAILMCIFRALFEDFQGKVEASWVHLYKSVQMIQRRGGPEAFRGNPTMTVIINVYSYRTRGYMQGTLLAFMIYPRASRNSLFPTGISEDVDMDGQNGTVSDADAEEVNIVCEELLTFLSHAEQLSALESIQINSRPNRRSMFEPGKSVFSAAINQPYDIIGSFPSLQNRSTFGMSVLLHLNAALWDFR